MLSYLSTKDFNIKKKFDTGLSKINTLRAFERYMVYFWILGPFIYLIERDPADLWLSLIAVIFLIRCTIKKDWTWIGQKWFVFAFLLWITGLISSILGPYKDFSFLQGFVWIRFPIYAAAAQVWLGKDDNIRIVMFVSILIGMIIMCAILTAEIFLDGPKTRLMWPYGDLVPGSYLTKISLPVYCALIVTLTFNLARKKILSFTLCIFSLIMVFFTGERGNFLIRFFSGVFALFSFKPNLKNVLKFFSIFFILILFFSVLFAKFNKTLFDRYTTSFFNSIPVLNTDKNYYWGAWRSGIQQGFSKPIIGLGPSSLRKNCKQVGYDDNSLPIYKLNSPEIKWLPGKNYCGNHPHNFYIQLFAETGIIGLILGSLMFFYIIKTCYDEKLSNPNCILTSICYIIPLAFFFPLQQTGSFFGQWNNLFIWFPIGFCLSQIQNYKSIFRK